MSYSMGSKAGSLSKGDVKKIAKGFGIAVAGSALAYLATEVIPMLQSMDLSPTGLMLVSISSVMVNTLMKLLSDTR